MKKVFLLGFVFLLAACGSEDKGRVRTEFKPFMNTPNKTTQSASASGDHKRVRGRL